MKDYMMIDEQEYQISVDYDLGGYSYVSSRNVERGYYLHFQPVERSFYDGYCTVRCEPRRGTKMLLFTVSRKSQKQLEKAIELAKESYIERIMLANGLEVDESILNSIKNLNFN